MVNHFNLQVRVVKWPTHDAPGDAVDGEFGAHHRFNGPMRRESSLVSEFHRRNHCALVMSVARVDAPRDTGEAKDNDRCDLGCVHVNPNC